MAGCYSGLGAKGGAKGLRNATTTAFVLATICIIIADFLITKLVIISTGVGSWLS